MRLISLLSLVFAPLPLWAEQIYTPKFAYEITLDITTDLKPDMRRFMRFEAGDWNVQPQESGFLSAITSGDPDFEYINANIAPPFAKTFSVKCLRVGTVTLSAFKLWNEDDSLYRLAGFTDNDDKALADLKQLARVTPLQAPKAQHCAIHLPLQPSLTIGGSLQEILSLLRGDFQKIYIKPERPNMFIITKRHEEHGAIIVGFGGEVYQTNTNDGLIVISDSYLPAPSS